MGKKKKIFNRFTALTLIMLLIFSVIVTRLSSLQIVNADEYIAKANTKSIRQIPEQAPRGKIVDKHGVVLATNKQSYTIEYMETSTGEDDFFTTFKKVFEYIDESSKKYKNDKLLDELELKVKPYRFEFTSSIKSVKRAQELQFKKDRGMQDIVEKELFEKKKEDSDLTDGDKKKINAALMKITPEETFDYLVFKYDLYKLLKLSSDEEKQLVKNIENKKMSYHELKEMLLKKYSVTELRRYLLVKDAIQMQSYSSYKPVTIASNVSKHLALLFQQVKSGLPGIDVSLEPIRYYPKGSLGSNFLGYISKIPESSSSKYEEKGYDTSTDYIGMAGLESAFEDRLKGSKGGTTVRVNSQGRATEELFKLDPYPGQNMVLTIDSKLQKVAEDALQERLTYLQQHPHQGSDVNTANATSGAAVVLDVKTGGVLAMASLPKYNPNLFSIPGKLTAKKSRELFSPDYKKFAEEYIAKNHLNVTPSYLFDFKTNRDRYNVYPKPFTNYATTATPVGSTFKPMTAIAALETGVYKPGGLINDTGIFTKNGFKGHDLNRPRGLIDLGEALAISCNYFFFELGDRLYNLGGLDELAKYAWKFGLGVDPKSNAQRSTGLEISEGFGNVYNDYTNRLLSSSSSSSFSFDMVNMLKAGKYNGFSFTPIDIGYNESDKKSIADAKAAIKARFKDAIMKGDRNSQNEFYNKLQKDMTPLFRKMISVLPDASRSQYKSNDAVRMAEALADMITYNFIPQVTTPGNVYNAALGQGIDQFTPVQMANYIATFANGGTRYKVHLVKEFRDASGKVVQKYKPEVVSKTTIKKSTFDAVVSGMKLVTSAEDGTAGSTFNNFPIQTAGKTGSATYIQGGKQEKVGRTSYGLYLGFAPVNKPKIAVFVIIYNGGHGGYVAEVAKKIYEQYFHLNDKKTKDTNDVTKAEDTAKTNNNNIQQ
ncbi:peptidoglycan D,D-transpeptidase FtsI family protein [Clostridium oryzae]|uniref:Peptidoglycan synthase FtsI n=1 Tax=Clostridium oryzae TaxID=1450648 RepID=A0A1V4IVD9_9CLOT|nr:penicillin-binding transpeptidase domain-containing protein [Clostridium oryzae]OPJ63754.1 peptidoglycan synthase FtsI precursor [Clostridium oryzae]